MNSSTQEITERREIEEEGEASRQAAVSVAMAELAGALLTPTSIDDIAHLVLRYAKSLTGSEFGFVSYIDPETGYNISATLTRDVWDLCEVDDKDVVFKHFTGLWGWVLNSKKSLITNDPANDPRSSGTPRGHVIIRRFLSVPAVIEEKLVGQIALANSQSAYTAEDLGLVERLAALYAIGLQRKRTEEALQEAHDQLELRVAERTAELVRANEQLRREIEERRRAEEQILKAKQMLQGVFDGISDPLVMLDENLCVKMLNEAALKYYGITDHRAMVGKPCYQAFKGQFSPCDDCLVPKGVMKGVTEVFERKGPFDSSRLEQVVIYPLGEVVGGLTGCILRISDITEQKKVEEKLIRTDRLSSLGQLSGGIAHEIRNPLSGINLFVDVLCDEEMFERTDRELEVFQEIKDNIKKIDGIIRRILDFAKESNGLESEIEMNSLIRENLKLWYERIRSGSIKLNLSLEKGLSAVYGDAVGIQQVLNNLVQNAVEAMADGGSLEISTQNDMSTVYADRRVVVIRVMDSGPGMAQEVQEKIFNPFFTTKSKGTGLGLSISHQIIERHGGTIACASKPGQGTTFTVELPVLVSSEWQTVGGKQ